MIERCNFKSNVTDGTHGCNLTYRNQYANDNCHGEDKCILYQIYKNATPKRVSVEGQLEFDIRRQQEYRMEGT